LAEVNTDISEVEATVLQNYLTTITTNKTMRTYKKQQQFTWHYSVWHLHHASVTPLRGSVGTPAKFDGKWRDQTRLVPCWNDRTALKTDNKHFNTVATCRATNS